jgi:hypothetical protein
MNAASAAAARPRPVEKLPAMQSSSRKVSKVGASRGPEKKSKSPARRPKRRPDSASAAPSRSSSHATSEQAQGQSKQQHQQVDINQFAATTTQAPSAMAALPSLPKPSTIARLERSHSHGNHSGIKWIIHIDCPGGHAAPLKIVTGLETLEQDDDESDDDENDDIDDIKEIQNMVGMHSQSSAVQGASASASDLTSSSKSLRVPAQQKSKFSSSDNHNRLQKLTQSMSGLDSRGLGTGLHYMAQEVASDDISSDDTIEGSEVLMMEEEDEGGEQIEEQNDRPRDRYKEAHVDVYDFSDDDDDSSGSSEASEDDRDRYLHARNLSDLPEGFDEDDQSIDPMENFSPRTSQDAQDDDLIADLPTGILTEPSTVLESCSTIEFSIAGSGPDIEEFDNGKGSHRRISALPEEAVLARTEMTKYDRGDNDDDQADQETEPGGVQATSSSGSQVRKQAEHSSARYKTKKSRRHIPAADKSSRRSKTFNASMPELQPEKDSSARNKSSKSRRQKPTEGKSSKPVKDSNASMPELQPEKDSSDRSKIGKARRNKSTPERDSNASMPELQPEKDSSDRSKIGKARRNKSTPEKSSKPVEDFNASMPELHRAVPDIGEDFESDSYFGLQGVLTSAVLKREAENSVSDQDPTGLLPSISSNSSSSAYNIEQKGRNPVQRTKSAPFAQLALSAKEGIQVCENKEAGEKKSRRRAPSRSKSDDGMLNFAQLDLTGDSSGVQFHDNETVNPSNSPTVVEKRSRRRAHDRSHSADDSMLNFAQLDLMGESGVQFHDNETVNLPDSPVAEKNSLRRGPGRSKSADSTLNFVPPQSAVEEEPDIPPSPEADKTVQTPTHIETPTPRSIRRLVKMGSNLISNRKLNKSNGNLKASDPENKKRFLKFGNASFNGSHRDLGDLLDDDDSFD